MGGSRPAIINAPRQEYRNLLGIDYAAGEVAMASACGGILGHLAHLRRRSSACHFCSGQAFLLGDEARSVRVSSRHVEGRATAVAALGSELGPPRYGRDRRVIATARVVDVQIERVSPNFFDGTASCRLRLRVPVCKVCRRVRGGALWLHVGQRTRFCQDWIHGGE